MWNHIISQFLPLDTQHHDNVDMLGGGRVDQHPSFSLSFLSIYLSFFSPYHTLTLDHISKSMCIPIPFWYPREQSSERGEYTIWNHIQTKKSLIATLNIKLLITSTLDNCLKQCTHNQCLKLWGSFTKIFPPCDMFHHRNFLTCECITKT